MGLNMDVDHVAFAGLQKFDGRRTRWLHATEVAQIAGRAGRFTRDGTFGTTGECEPMDEDLIEAVQDHSFDPVRAAEWRNARLDFSTLRALMASLAVAPGREGLVLTKESLDERALKALAAEPAFAGRVRDKASLMRLWEVCQTPDFRKVAPEEHLRLLRDLFTDLTSGRRRVSADWMAQQLKPLDRNDGEIETLAARLASVRTLSYLANRPDWLADAAHWRALTHALEGRLSDTLHEKLMARFIDRRTSVLMRQLGLGDEVVAGVADDGTVTVEGCLIGQLKGVHFELAGGQSALELRALRGAANRAVTPEINRRLGSLAAAADKDLSLAPNGMVLWRGEAAGQLTGGRKARLLGELGAGPARERAQQRLAAFVAAQAQQRLAPLGVLERALAGGELRGLPRGLAHRLIEAGGVIDRAGVETEVAALSQNERRALRVLGVRIGAFSLYLPGLLTADAIACAVVLSDNAWRPAPGEIVRLPDPAPAPAVLAARGLRALAGRAAPVTALEALDERLRAARRPDGVSILSEADRTALGWSEADANAILRGLGFVPATVDGVAGWKRRRSRSLPAAAPVDPASPFAALAVLKTAPERRRRRARRKVAAQAVR
jgi:ATP-dependent RNA helicase SUPV3L1/SUV3